VPRFCWTAGARHPDDETMKPTLPLLAALALPAFSSAQTAATPTAAPAPTPATSGKSAGLVNDWLRQQNEGFSDWDIGGQFRARLEHREDFAVPGLRPEAVDFRKEGGADNTYVLFRERIHLGYNPAPWFSAFVEARDSRSVNDRRSPDPESDSFDLHQGYVRFGDAREFPLTAKVGRQELAYGDERLIGAFEWNNIGRVFDAAKLRYERGPTWVDAFVGRVVIPDNHNFNVPNDYDFFSGLYASTTALVPWQETQLYFLARNVSEQSPEAIGANLPPFMRGATERDVYTLGFRVKSLPGKLAGWDYEAEVAGQLGNYHMTATGPELDHEAFAAHVGGGYTFRQTPGSPRVGLTYSYASGDDDPTDGTHGTFDNLFPTNHKFYGYMDFFSWQNVHNVRLTTSIKPLKKLTVTLDYHAFWLADTADFFYQANGAPRTGGGYGVRPDAGRFVGTELDLIVTYNLTPFSSIQGGYGHFFVGDYVKDSLRPVGGATDADWLYLQWVLNF
jgi:hypothetical protein